MKTTPRIGKVSVIHLADDTTEMMLISQFGKIVRIDTKTIRSAGRSTSGVKLLNLDADDKVAAAVVIPPEGSNAQPENGATALGVQGSQACLFYLTLVILAHPESPYLFLVLGNKARLQPWHHTQLTSRA